MLEYFNSTHGARKGLADTALKTANSGYLTRRLVDVAQDCVIVADDCGTEEGLSVAAHTSGGDVKETLSERILGRVVQEDVYDLETNELIVEKGSLVTESHCEKIEKSGVQIVKIRSVLTCEMKQGICGKMLWS